MGKTEVEWTLQLTETYNLSKDLKTFFLSDLINELNQSEKEVRRNVLILLSLKLLKSINIKKNLYKFIG